MDEEKHVPGATETETTVEVQPETTEDAPKEPESETTTTPEPKPEENKPEAPAEPPVTKPRSIYDAHKETKHKLKETRSELETAQARVAELEGLLAKKDEAETPKEKSKAAADIQEYAKKHGLDADSLDELTQVILSKVPKSESSLTPEEAEEWRKDRATAKQREEDQSILNEAPSVKKELGITDDVELQNVMKEVVRLAHTKAFHDKEVDYIVWKNREALSKLVSPKKPSFEAGGQNVEAAAEEEVTLSSKATPQQAEKALQGRNKAPGLEIRHASR
jgi:hypothetical protein